MATVVTCPAVTSAAGIDRVYYISLYYILLGLYIYYLYYTIGVYYIISIYMQRHESNVLW